MSESLLGWFSAILGVVGPILLLLISAKIERRNKKEDQNREAERKDRQKETDDLKEMIKDLKGDVQKIDTEVTTLRSTVSQMQQYDNTVREDLQAVSQYHERTGKYVSELGNVVMTLAEGMRDEHLDGNITAAVASYRKFEREQLDALMSRPPIKG